MPTSLASLTNNINCKIVVSVSSTLLSWTDSIHGHPPTPAVPHRLSEIPAALHCGPRISHSKKGKFTFHVHIQWNRKFTTHVKFKFTILIWGVTNQLATQRLSGVGDVAFLGPHPWVEQNAKLRWWVWPNTYIYVHTTRHALLWPNPRSKS